MRKCFGGVTVIVIQGTPPTATTTSPPSTADGVALRPSCHLAEFHTSYFFPPVFIHLSTIFLNSTSSSGNCSRTFVSLLVLRPPACPFLPPHPNPPPHLLLPPVAAAFLLRLRKGTSHEPFNRGESRRAPLNWHF